MLRKLSILPLLLILAACQSLGLAPADTFEKGWSYAQAHTTGLRDTCTRALDAHKIGSGDMEYCIATADRSRDMLALARAAHASGDISTAHGRLALVSGVLNELEQYLITRGVQ